MYYELEGGHGHRDAGLEHNPWIALIAPRPIGWISTLSTDGRANLAPFSFFNALSSRPPLVMFCANGPHLDGGRKDSLANARETGEFVHNLATLDLAKQVNDSSTPAPRDVDEFELAGLTKAPSRRVRAPRVAESPVNVECKVHDIIDLPAQDDTHRNTMVIGRVVAVHIRDDVVVDGRVDLARIRPLTRLGYLDYSTIGEMFHMSRPMWKKPPLKEHP